MVLDKLLFLQLHVCEIRRGGKLKKRNAITEAGQRPDDYSKAGWMPFRECWSIKAYFSETRSVNMNDRNSNRMASLARHYRRHAFCWTHFVSNERFGVLLYFIARTDNKINSRYFFKYINTVTTCTGPMLSWSLYLYYNRINKLLKKKL